MPQTTGVSAAQGARQPVAQSGPALISPGFRRTAAALVVAGAAVMSLLAVLVAGHTRETWLDHAVDNRIMAPPGHAGLAGPMAQLGSPVSVTVLSVILVAACLVTRRFRGAWLVAAAAPAVGLADIGLKHLVHRTYAGFLSFPSGHTMGAFSMATVGVILLLGPLHPALSPRWRRMLAALAVLVACAVALCLVIRRMHYFTDTIGGAALAIAMVLAAAFAVDAAANRWTRSRPPAA